MFIIKWPNGTQRKKELLWYNSVSKKAGHGNYKIRYEQYEVLTNEVFLKLLMMKIVKVY